MNRPTARKQSPSGPGMAELRSRRRPSAPAARAQKASEWIAWAMDHLDSRKVPEARASVDFIMAAVLKCGRGELVLHLRRLLTDVQGRSFRHMVLSRGKRLPLAYILGNQDFMGLTIKVTEDVLIPRPETEEVVEYAAQLLSDELDRRPRSAKVSSAGKPLRRLPPHVLDIGTGTGCIAIALGHLFPEALIYATEISAKALSLARRNALAQHTRNLRFLDEDLFKPAVSRRGWAHMVISNPPYIPTAELDTLEPEVRFEPRLALDGGPDGLSALRAIIKDSPLWLKSGGLLVLEIGAGQGGAVHALMMDAGFGEAWVRKDLAGHERIAVGRFSGASSG